LMPDACISISSEKPRFKTAASKIDMDEKKTKRVNDHPDHQRSSQPVQSS
jgi:hypothetical protein